MKPTYVLDAGHGGQDSGAVNADTGLMEKNVALSVCVLLKGLCDLDGRINAVMTRHDDRFLTLGERARIANQLANATLLSVHCNAGGGAGYEAFTSPGQTASDDLATDLLFSYARKFPNRRMREELLDGDPDKEARFAVLTRTRGKAVLFEIAFIDTAGGAAFLAEAENLRRIASALFDGILMHEFGTTEQEVSEQDGAPESDPVHHGVGEGDAALDSVEGHDGHPPRPGIHVVGQEAELLRRSILQAAHIVAPELV